MPLPSSEHILNLILGALAPGHTYSVISQLSVASKFLKNLNNSTLFHYPYKIRCRPAGLRVQRW